MHDEDFLFLLEPFNSVFVQLLEKVLHKGEAKSIALALEVRLDILLLDESEATGQEYREHLSISHSIIQAADIVPFYPVHI